MVTEIRRFEFKVLYCSLLSPEMSIIDKFE